MHWELIKLRKENGVSKTEIARLLDIKSIETYTKKEDGDVDFKLSEMFTIAKFFGRGIEEIFLPRYIRNPDKKGVVK